MSWIRGPLVGGVVAALGLSHAAADGGKRLAKALGSDRVRIERIEAHRFEDLDRDGVKEVLVQATGSFPGSFPEGTEVVPLGAGTGPLASGAGSGAFAGVFRFDRETFRWVPALVAPYRTGGIAAFEAWGLGSGACLVRLAHVLDGQVLERLYRTVPGGLEQVFHATRGDQPGEGLWFNADKLLLTRAIEDPFAARPGPPGFLARTRYRWNGTGLMPESWTLSGLGFKGDLELGSSARWEGLEGRPAEACRKAWEWQRAGDRGAAPYRKSVAGLADHRWGAGTYRIVQEQKGLAVVVPMGAGDTRPRYLVQPFRGARGADAVWVDLEEIGEASW